MDHERLSPLKMNKDVLKRANPCLLDTPGTTFTKYLFGLEHSFYEKVDKGENKK